MPAGVSVAVPGANSTVEVSLPPPPLEASSANGAVTALTIRLPIAFRITPASENCGSLIEPLTGRSMSITPLRSASSAAASLTGRLAVEPSAFSPKTSWLRTIRLLAVSWPSGCTW